jgi:hypothetical protein
LPEQITELETATPVKNWAPGYYEVQGGSAMSDKPADLDLGALVWAVQDRYASNDRILNIPSWPEALSKETPFYSHQQVGVLLAECRRLKGRVTELEARVTEDEEAMLLHAVDAMPPAVPQAPADGELCQHCGSPYTTVYRVPDSVWLDVIDKAPNGLLCVECCDRLARDAGYELYWEADDDRYPTEAPPEGKEEMT